MIEIKIDPTKASRTSIVLWGAWYGSHNVGDQLLLLSITDMLGEVIENPHFFVLTSNPEHVRAYTHPNSNLEIEPVYSRKEIWRVVKILYQCQIFIFGGGVPFFETPDHLRAMIFLIGLLKLFRKPYLTWSVSSQPIRHDFTRKVFRWVLEGARAITVRDSFTINLFRSCGVTKETILTPDPAFACCQHLEPEDPKIRTYLSNGERPFVALTPRHLRGRDGEVETHYQAKTPQQYELELRCFAAAYDWLWEHGFQPIFLPMNTIAPDDDRAAARAVIQKTHYSQSVLMINEPINPREAAWFYSQCAVSFVARVHGSISSMIGNCPVMMYAFDPKYIGIMESMGLQEFIVPEDKASPELTIAVLSRLVERQNEIKSALREKLRFLQEGTLIPAKIVTEILGK